MAGSLAAQRYQYNCRYSSFFVAGARSTKSPWPCRAQSRPEIYAVAAISALQAHAAQICHFCFGLTKDLRRISCEGPFSHSTSGIESGGQNHVTTHTFSPRNNRLKLDYRPDRFTGVHEIEPFVDLIQRQFVGDHWVDLDLAVHVPIHDFRHIRPT